MKSIFQLFTLILAALAIVACSDPQKDMQADIASIEQITEKSESLQKIQQLQSQLVSGSLDKQQLKQAFTEISAEYTKLKDGIAKLSLKSPEGKKVQTKFVNAIGKFITLMDKSAEYSATPPTQDQATDFTQLQQESTSELADASNALLELKNKVTDKK